MKQIIFSLLLMGLGTVISAQSVGVGTTIPDSSAILELKSTNKGILMPRMTTAQRDSIVDPAIGLQILNLDDFCLDIYDGVSWIKNCGMRITGMDTIPSSWSLAGSYGGGSRTHAAAFSIGSKGYVGTGYLGADPTLDFWEFDPVTNTWTQKANVGYDARAEASAFAINGKGYIGLGDGVNTFHLTDLWEYDPATNTWSPKTSFPGDGRRGSAAFSVNNSGYIAGGFKWNFPNDIILSEAWRYTPETDTWEQISSMPWFLGSAVGFSIGDYGYVGTGFSRSVFSSTVFPVSTFYLYQGGEWTTMSDFGGGIRYHATGFSSGACGYVGTGQLDYNVFKKDIWKWDANTEAWSRIADFGGTSRGAAVGFCIEGKGYLGLGVDGSNSCVDFWALELYPQGPIFENNLPVENAAVVNDGIWTKSVDKIYLTTPELLGIGTSNPVNSLDVSAGLERTGIHPINRPLYVTGDIGPSYKGVEIRHSNSTQGIGFGFNTIYAAGSNFDQDLGMSAKGAEGKLVFSTHAVERITVLGNGNVGIGTTTTNAPLQFATEEKIRKLVLFDNYNNDHQFFGFGVNSGALQYQTDSPFTDHAFFAATSESNSKELMRIKGNGNVGVGITPTNKMDIQTGVARTGSHPADLALYVTSNSSSASSGVEFRNNNGLQGIGFGYNTIYATGSVADQDLGLASRGAGGLVYSTNGTERMRIKGDGKVGGGVASPSNQMDIHAGAARTGNHPSNLPLYVTGDIGADTMGMEVRHNNGTQGIGIGYNTVYAAGSSANQDINLAAKGLAGSVGLETNDSIRVVIKPSGDVNIAKKLEIGYVQVIGDPVSIPGFSFGSAICNCPAGTVVVGGGFDYNASAGDMTASRPNNTTSWITGVYNADIVSHTLKAYAICARLGN